MDLVLSKYGLFWTYLDPSSSLQDSSAINFLQQTKVSSGNATILSGGLQTQESSSSRSYSNEPQVTLSSHNDSRTHLESVIFNLYLTMIYEPILMKRRAMFLEYQDHIV